MRSPLNISVINHISQLILHSSSVAFVTGGFTHTNILIIIFTHSPSFPLWIMHYVRVQTIILAQKGIIMDYSF